MSRMKIEKISKFAFNFSNIDTIFINAQSHKEWEFGYNQVPEPLMDYFGDIQNLLNLQDNVSDQLVLFHSTSFKLNFISAKLYEQKDYIGTILVGPYLLEEPAYHMIHDVLFDNKVSISLSHIVEQYYLSLPLISTYRAITIAEFLAFLALNFEHNNFVSEKSVIGRIDYDFQMKNPIIPDTLNLKNKPSVSAIEERYRTQNEIMSAVENGNRAKLEKIINEELFSFGKLPDRIPNDPLRSRKNLAFVTNTLLRISAERGGLHPVYIDSISEKYAIHIEKTSTIQQLSDLQMKMYFEYCDAVKKLSLKQFNRLIRNAIEFIRLNLDQDLRLETIAGAINASRYELSRQFKKETGKSITEYINEMRINEAIKIMESENLTITDIAQLVGFNDVNYFTKVFKKVFGMTPSKYRNSVNGVRHH